MEHGKVVKYGIVIFIFEVIITTIWFFVVKPESSVAFEILEIVLLLFGINLIMGLILYFLNKQFAVLILANSIICPLIFYAIWIMWFTFWAK